MRFSIFPRAGLRAGAVALLSAIGAVATAAGPAHPGAEWEARSPGELGLDAARLGGFRDAVGGRGCVVRHGAMAFTWGDPTLRADVASACKPVLGHLLMQAIEEGRLPGLEARVVGSEPRLAALNADRGYKDREITFRHMINQTSCYGVSEAPGAAFDYNDWQMALLADTLIEKVYGSAWRRADAEVLRPRLSGPLGCQDDPTLLAFGPDDRPGRLAISVRDFARFGLLYLHEGQWGDASILDREHARRAVASPLPNALPRTSGRPAEMIPGQRTLGSKVVPDDQTDHLGSYSFAWWTNGIDREGRRHWPSAPVDTFAALGHGGKRALVVIPSLDLVVSWNDARVEGREAEDRALALLVQAVADRPGRRTEVAIRGEDFLINGRPTYAGRTWRGHRIEGLLLNSRMVQGIFDDLNPETRPQWAYPDTGRWDPERNTREFLAAMPEWRRHGLLAFTINLQGGSPQGYSKGRQPWHNSAITETGALRPDSMDRLGRILDRADELGMVAILGIFYFGQDERLEGEAAVLRAVDNATDWVFDHGYRNVLIEVNNECNVRYDHAILRPDRVHELIERVKSRARDGLRLLAGTSYGGGTVPEESVVRASDFLLMHGNGVGDPARIAEMVRRARRVPGYRPMPILFNEDDQLGFDEPANNFASALSEHASWGYFDPGESNDRDGYQSPPVNWGINTERKRAFFERVREIAGE